MRSDHMPRHKKGLDSTPKNKKKEYSLEFERVWRI
jgi:hypothetical protein